MMSSKINFQFKNELYNKTYHKKGFVILPVFDKNDLKLLQEIYKNYQAGISKEDQQKYSSAQHASKSLALQVSSQISPIIESKLFQEIINADSLLAAFLIKPPRQNAKQALPWHQALSYVDEAKYEEAMVWIGLEEQENDNWEFELLPQTHKFSDYIRTAPSYPLFEASFLQWMLIKKEKIRLKPGEALIFNHRLLNCSPENCSEIESRAVQLPIKVKEASWVYFVKNESRIKQYAANPNFFLDLWTESHLDESCLEREFSYSFPKMKWKQFIKFLFT